jgi:cell division protein FtsB
MRRSRSNHQDIRSKRRQFITYALGFGAFVLFVNALVGDNGYLAALRTRREHADVAARLAKKLAENDQLTEEVRLLKTDTTTLEEAAREFDLIRPGETLFIIKDAKPPATPPAPPAGK